jgi:para-nitrobenzyl esterase
VTAGSYQSDIASVLGVPDGRAAAIAAEYSLATYPSPAVAFSALVGDANFACPALQIDQLTSRRVPTFAYEFNDDNAPLRFAPKVIPPPVATHTSELGYLFDLQGVGPTVVFPGTLDAGQEALAASMRAAWAAFAASSNPATAAVPWPAFSGSGGSQMLSLVPPQPQPETDFSALHHCAFWAAG